MPRMQCHALHHLTLIFLLTPAMAASAPLTSSPSPIPTDSNASSGRDRSRSEMSGIFIGATMGVLTIVVAIIVYFCLRRRRRRRAAASASVSAPMMAAEMGTDKDVAVVAADPSGPDDKGLEHGNERSGSQPQRLGIES
ncbi:hypothetical protein BDW74DRAFT_147685 [Aspergillus multicolor]|uniref:uncharacterized protein n=1 Tax=Aspergillus multicolor TaxID=41759 RepID=UPI003CCDA492